MTAPDAQREAIYRAAVRQMTEDQKGAEIAPEAVVRPEVVVRRRPRPKRTHKVRSSRLLR